MLKRVNLAGLERLIGEALNLPMRIEAEETMPAATYARPATSRNVVPYPRGKLKQLLATGWQRFVAGRQDHWWQPPDRPVERDQVRVGLPNKPRESSLPDGTTHGLRESRLPES